MPRVCAYQNFSSFGLQTFALLKDDQFALATANIAISNILGLLLVWAGYALAKAIKRLWSNSVRRFRLINSETRNPHLSALVH